MSAKSKQTDFFRNIKLTIEYDGTSFHGWQVQPGDKRTVQGEIEKALKQITGHKTKLIGSGRTDQGVHALGQVANFQTNAVLSTESWLKALNANLPDDVTVVKAQEVSQKFHAQFSVKTKTYRYTVLNRGMRCSVGQQYCSFYPYPLYMTLMRQEAKQLVGRKDFLAFQSSDPVRRKKIEEGHIPNTIRTIKTIQITQNGDFIHIDIEANGFLYKMVRNIVGALLEVASGKIPKGSIQKMLISKKRKPAFQTAPAQGLCLMSVKYPKSYSAG